MLRIHKTVQYDLHEMCSGVFKFLSATVCVSPLQDDMQNCVVKRWSVLW